MHTKDLHSGLPLLLTFSDCARELGVSLNTVRRLINTGKLPVVLLDTGKTMAPSKRVRRTDLLAYVDGLES